MALNGIMGDDHYGYELVETRRPSMASLEVFQARLSQLRAPTVGELPEVLLDELSNVFLVMPSQAADPVRRTRVYLQELSDLPAWAAVRVLRQFIRGELGDSRFAPTIAEIRQAILKLEAPFLRERARIEKVLKFWGDENAADGTPALKVVR